jgi:RHS repeat-associated protein
VGEIPESHVYRTSRHSAGKYKICADIRTKHRSFKSHPRVRVHMNGRMYDPELGRFLGVDPLMQAPLNSQSLNPYSYVMNNPLAGTDPTGYAGECAEQDKQLCSPQAPEDGEKEGEKEDISDKKVDKLEVDKKGNLYVTTGDVTYKVDKVTNNSNGNEVSGQQIGNTINVANEQIEALSGRDNMAGNSDNRPHSVCSRCSAAHHEDSTRHAHSAGTETPSSEDETETSDIIKGPVLDSAKTLVYSPYNAIRGGKAHIGADLHAYDENGNRVLDAGILSGTEGTVDTIWSGHVELGNAVTIRSGSYYITYAHMSKVGDLKKGQSVELGDSLGTMGCTGKCDGAHLHLQIKDTLQKGGNSFSPGKAYDEKGWITVP